MMITCKQNQDILTYLADIHKAVKRVHDLNRVLPKECAIEIPESFVRAKLIRAMKMNPLFKTLLDNLLVTVDHLYHQLQNVSANCRDMEVRGAPQQGPGPTGLKHPIFTRRVYVTSQNAGSSTKSLKFKDLYLNHANSHNHNLNSNNNGSINHNTTTTTTAPT